MSDDNGHTYLSARMALTLNAKQRRGLHVLHEQDCIIIQGGRDTKNIYPVYLALAQDDGMQARYRLEYVEKLNQIIVTFREWKNDEDFR